jgi:hypothetical protein
MSFLSIGITGMIGILVFIFTANATGRASRPAEISAFDQKPIKMQNQKVGPFIPHFIENGSRITTSGPCWS